VPAATQYRRHAASYIRDTPSRRATVLDLFMQYGLFLAKAVTIVISLFVVIALIASVGERRRHQREEGSIEVTRLNDRYEDYEDGLREAVLDEDDLKAWHKEQKKQAKAEKKAEKKDAAAPERKRVFVLDFKGDISASATDNLRREITAILTLAQPGRDEVALVLESPGGMVHGYGLAASQLERIRQKNIPLTICVDKVAASGGYMMACLGNKILAAPFAVVGSIGVVAQLPNFHRLLEKHDIDFEVLTAGEYKRTLTIFGKNTDAGRQKFQEELEDTHVLFKDFVKDARPSLDIAKVATGEHWYGKRAIELGLVDQLITSDQYLYDASKEADVFGVRYIHKQKLAERLGFAAEAAADRLMLKWWERVQQRYFV
jgi:serine protease SohB